MWRSRKPMAVAKLLTSWDTIVYSPRYGGILKSTFFVRPRPGTEDAVRMPEPVPTELTSSSAFLTSTPGTVYCK